MIEPEIMAEMELCTILSNTGTDEPHHHMPAAIALHTISHVTSAHRCSLMLLQVRPGSGLDQDQTGMIPAARLSALAPRRPLISKGASWKGIGPPCRSAGLGSVRSKLPEGRGSC